ncbi:MAG: hypothetical protein AAF604_23225 [Acidobacteriota bacterium]
MPRKQIVLLFAFTLIVCLAPAAAEGQVGECSDAYCASVSPLDFCYCPHCPWVVLECYLRPTCAIEASWQTLPDGKAKPGLEAADSADQERAGSAAADEGRTEASSDAR